MTARGQEIDPYGFMHRKQYKKEEHARLCVGCGFMEYLYKQRFCKGCYTSLKAGNGTTLDKFPDYWETDIDYKSLYIEFKGDAYPDKEEHKDCP